MVTLIVLCLIGYGASRAFRHLKANPITAAKLIDASLRHLFGK